MTNLPLNNQLRIGLFGGSFNPPHFGHLGVSNAAIKALNLDKVFWLVVPTNPFKKDKDYLNLSERLLLCRKLVDKNRKVKVVDFESDLKTFETYNTIKKAKKVFYNCEIFWIMGDDSMISFHLWKNNDFIANNVKIAIFNRGNMHRVVRCQSYTKYMPALIWSKIFDVSSTKVRNKLGHNWKNSFKIHYKNF